MLLTACYHTIFCRCMPNHLGIRRVFQEILGDAGAPTPWDGGVADPQEHTTPPGLIIPNLVAPGQTIWAYIGDPKIWGSWGPPIEMGDVDDPYKHASPPPVLPCQIWSYLIKPYEFNYGDTLEKFDPSHSAFKITQGHWNRHRSIGHLLLPISHPWAYIEPFPR